MSTRCLFYLSPYSSKPLEKRVYGFQQPLAEPNMSTTARFFSSPAFPQKNANSVSPTFHQNLFLLSGRALAASMMINGKRSDRGLLLMVFVPSGELEYQCQHYEGFKVWEFHYAFAREAILSIWIRLCIECVHEHVCNSANWNSGHTNCTIGRSQWLQRTWGLFGSC